jgi:hypothetical protein
LLGEKRQHFLRALSITTPAELRQGDHKAVIAWKRYIRESEHRRLRRSAGGSRRVPPSISTSCRTTTQAAIPSVGVERLAINRDEGSTLAFAKAQARKLLDAPAENTVAG